MLPGFATLGGLLYTEDPENPSSWAWVFFFILTAVFAGGVGITVLVGSVDLYVLAGVAALFLWMWLTRRQWANKAPSESQRGYL